jgi:predicted nucleic acid-binding protein
MILLDTNVLSKPLRSRPDPAVAAWLDAQQAKTLFLSTITVAEIRFGIAVLPKGKRRDTLADRFERDVLPVFDDRVLPFDEPATHSYANLRSMARRRGSPMGDVDAVIASIADSRGLLVATRDTTPSDAVQVPTINPFSS